MFTSRIQKAESRSVFVLGKGDASFAVEIVREFSDHVTCDGVVFYRRLTDVRVEGDLPLTVKRAVGMCLRRGAYLEAQSWIDGYVEALA